MQELFFIIKGQYTPKKGIESFDPTNSDTMEWYQVRDKYTYHCIACSCNLEKVLHAIFSTTQYFKGNVEEYFKCVQDTTTEDYYNVHYLNKPPLTPEQRSKSEKRTRVSVKSKEMFKEIYNSYGDFYADEVAGEVNKALGLTNEEKPTKMKPVLPKKSHFKKKIKLKKIS